MTYDLGAVVPLAAQTHDADGVLADAGSVALAITLPDGTVFGPTPIREGVGKYFYDFTPTQAGLHQVRWVATGANAGVFTDVLDVRPVGVRYLVSLRDAKEKCHIPLDDTSRDRALGMWIEAVTDVIETYTGLTLARAEVVEDLVPDTLGRLLLTQSPVRALTSAATVDGATTWPVGGLTVSSIGLVTGARFTGTVRVAYTAGGAILPAKYRQAALLIVQHLWGTERANTKGGPMLRNPEQMLEQWRITGYALPHAATDLLGAPMPSIA